MSENWLHRLSKELFVCPSGTITTAQQRSLQQNRYNSQFNTFESTHNCIFVTIAFILGSNSLSISRFLGIEQRCGGETVERMESRFKSAGFKIHKFPSPKLKEVSEDFSKARMKIKVYDRLPRTFGVLVRTAEGGGHAQVGKKMGDGWFRMVRYQKSEDGYQDTFEDVKVFYVFWVELPEAWLRAAEKEMNRRRWS